MTGEATAAPDRLLEKPRGRAMLDRIFGLLSRESSTGQFIAEIDGLRFVAIMAVLLYHLKGFTVRTLGLEWRADPFAVLLDKGNVGVQLFFVISGFIIAHPFAQRLLNGRPAVPLGSYLTRRITRLEPPYIINLVVVFVLLIGVRHESFAGLWPHLVASIFYLHNVIYGAHSLVNGVAWSLEIECQFYLLAPLMVSVFRISSAARRRAILVAAIAVTSVAPIALFGDDPRLKLSLLNFLGYFLVGFLLADLHLVTWKGRPAHSYLWDVAALSCWISIAALLHARPSLHVLLPAPIFGAYCGAFRGRIFNAIFTNRLVYTIGGMCYTIYLYHFFVLAVFAPLALEMPLLARLPVWGVIVVMSAVVVPPALLVCAVLFVVTEKPFMRRHWPLALRQRLAVVLEK